LFFLPVFFSTLLCLQACGSGFAVAALHNRNGEESTNKTCDFVSRFSGEKGKVLGPNRPLFEVKSAVFPLKCGEKQGLFVTIQ